MHTILFVLCHFLLFGQKIITMEMTKIVKIFCIKINHLYNIFCLMPLNFVIALCQYYMILPVQSQQY